MIKKLISSAVQNLYGATQPFATASTEYGPMPMPPPPPPDPTLTDIPSEILTDIPSEVLTDIPPKMSIFLPVLFLILIPIILLVGVFALAKKKRFSKSERVWAVVIVLLVYLFVLINAVFYSL